MNASEKITAALRPLFQEKYEEIHRFHLKGASGAHVVKALSDLADRLILKGFQSLDSGIAQGWGGTLIAIGGYGRQELSPSSDIDLMFLYPEGQAKETETVSSYLLCILWDLGYTVGHSMRTVEQTIVLAREDALIATSLLESRFLQGDRGLFKDFHTTFFSKVIDKHIKEVLAYLKEGREAGRLEYGATPYLLEPNLKQSPGGLRDIHYLKWVASARYHTHHLPQVHQWGHLSNIEYTSLSEGQDFLWKVRNHLHFLAGRPSDHLTIDLQEEIAPFFELQDRRGFMHHYYLQTGRILEISKRFTRETASVGRVGRWRRSWKTRQVAPGFQVFSGEISIQSDKPFQFFEDDANMLRLFLLAKTHAVRIADDVLEVIYQLSEEKRDIPLNAASISLFKTLITEPGGIAKSLRLMHQVRLLWRIIPEFSVVNCMVQESRSHTFTVDEHSFRALEAAEQFLNVEGPLQEIYVGTPRKDLLHLGILLHDIGKGRQEDHSTLGSKIAKMAAERLSYNEKEVAEVVFLVQQHLMFSEIALYRDFTDEPVLHQFIDRVRKFEPMRKLFILTCADMSATAPGMLSAWKKELLLKLYDESALLLNGKVTTPETKKVAEITEKVFKTLAGEYPEPWLKELLLTLIPRYYLITAFDKVLLDIDALSQLPKKNIQIETRFLSDQEVTEYNLYTYDWMTSGIFSSMVGVLASKGLHILGAQVFTHPNGMVIDTFKVIDPDHREGATDERIAGIVAAIEAVLRGEESVETLLKKSKRFPTKKEREALSQTAKNIRIQVDNQSSRTFTVIDIFAPDKRGLLFTISKVIVGLGLSVHAAKIVTRLDQVVDVFYVLGENQKKVTQAAAIVLIQDRLKKALEKEFGNNVVLK